MKAMTWVCRALLGLGAVASFVGCSSGSDGSEGLLGVATLAVTAAPSDVNCIRITVAGARTVVQNLPVMPGQSTVFPLSGLPVGNDTFTGEGFAGACPPAAGAVATWASTPTPATVTVNPPVNVTITMVRNGRSTVGVDFQDDGTATCTDMIKNGAESDVDCGGGACAPCAQGRTCSTGMDCSTGVCLGGLCGGCTTNADCPAGLICDPAQRQCVSACSAPRINCGGACVDPSTDARNCGVCGNVCASGTACTNGMCSSVVCMAGQTRCANACVNLANDPSNCGACGLICAPGQACSNGVCNMAPNTCFDGLRDNAESGVDCGGPTPCPRCPTQQTCMAPSDCISMICLLGRCN